MKDSYFPVQNSQFLKKVVGVEKVASAEMIFPRGDWALEFLFCLLSVCLGGCREIRIWSLAEEADQSFDVLGSRGQEELLTNKLHPA